MKFIKKLEISILTEMKFRFKINSVPAFPLCIVILISCFALITMYSISAGSFFPWCFKQLFRLIFGLMILFTTLSIKISFWKNNAYIFYIICLFMLLCVEIIGKVSMGAQRWLSFYFFNFQPSELMRIFLVISIAKYFSCIPAHDIKKTKSLIIPLILAGIPMFLVLMQPDLGTATILLCICVSMLFAYGVQIWKFIVAFVCIVIATPIIWNTLHEYQKNRIIMFLSPEMDPNGAGYHIIQSKISLGSGGIFGKGFMNGSQCQLNFLPEKQTDFVFAALGEELGFVGCSVLIILYGILLSYNFAVSLRAKGKFKQLLVFGINSMLFFYIFINISMVCGLLPVVGIPLPFFSYGGSALIVLMFCQGLIFAVDIEQQESRGIKYYNF